jgi:hypothetical protein
MQGTRHHAPVSIVSAELVPKVVDPELIAPLLPASSPFRGVPGSRIRMRVDIDLGSCRSFDRTDDDFLRSDSARDNRLPPSDSRRSRTCTDANNRRHNAHTHRAHGCTNQAQQRPVQMQSQSRSQSLAGCDAPGTLRANSGCPAPTAACARSLAQLQGGGRHRERIRGFQSKLHTRVRGVHARRREERRAWAQCARVPC